MTDLHDHDRGLAFDLQTLSRRRLLTIIGGVGLATLVGCGRDDDPTASGSDASCSPPIPEETAGPFPGDGSNGPNVLTESEIVRRDITASFGSSTTTAEGVPTTVNLVLQDTGNGCTALSDAAVYLWHCDREGRYSLYSDGVTGENYLRGVQVADRDGRLSFTTIFPAAYPGRWPHMHFEIYSSITDARSGGTPMATSQLAIPEPTCTAVYATVGYERSARTMQQTSLTSDNVFAEDGAAHQLASAAGSVDAGYTLELTVPV